MGQTPSHYTSNNLYAKIQNEIRHMIYNYQIWTDDKICDKLETIYHDKLITFNKSDILNATMSIGLKHETDVPKDELCHRIIIHYKKRLDILIKIKNALEKSYDQILSVTSGNVCRNVDEYVGDFFTCAQKNGLWLNEEQYQAKLKQIKQTAEHNLWIKYVTGLDKNWKKYINKLNKIITVIKNDVDNNMSDASFDELNKHTDEVIRKMKYVCDIYCLIIINF